MGLSRPYFRVCLHTYVILGSGIALIKEHIYMRQEAMLYSVFRTKSRFFEGYVLLDKKLSRRRWNASDTALESPDAILYDSNIT